MRWLVCCLVVCLALCREAAGDTVNQDDQDNMNYYLDMSYQHSGGLMNPHDMLADHSETRGSRPSRFKEDEEETNIFYNNKNGDCKAEQEQINFEEKQLLECNDLLSKLKKNYQVEQQKLLLMQEKHATESPIDMQAFYTRLIHHLWKNLELEETLSILRDDSTAMLKHLTVHVTRSDLDALQGFLQHGHHIHQVDQFVEQSFTLNDPPDDYNGNSIQAFLTLVWKGLEVGKNVELWLYILCLVFLVFACWALLLFVRDIHRELRWRRILIMMVVLVFFICCLWHWRHMHKVAESKRHAKMVKRGFSDVPEECKPGGRGTASSVFEWIKVNIFFSPDVCEKYFEELMIDPMEEITPAMVIAETLAKFCLQPLQHIGSEAAKLITNFYGNVPPVYHIPATAVFLVLLVVILFYSFGYGIDFPLWLGGIRPIYRTKTADTSEVDRITREAVAQLNQDRERFLEESRNILTDITRAASLVQGQSNLQPLMYMSSHILENQLEQLISRQIGFILNRESSALQQQRQLPELLPDSELNTSVTTTRTHHTGSGRHTINTVTSTPLRSEATECTGEGMSVKEGHGYGVERSANSRRKDQSIHVNVEARKRTKEQSSESCVKQEDTSVVDSRNMSYRPGLSSPYKNNRPLGLAASTDGVHHRLQGLQKAKILPPKRNTPDRGSTSSLDDRKEEKLSEKQRRKRLEKGKLGHSEGDLDDNEGWRVRLGRFGRKFHSTNSVDRDPSPSSCSTNTNSSSQDLSVRQPSEYDHEVFDRPGPSGVPRSGNTYTSGSDGHNNTTSTSDEFFLQVKHLLEDSANSSQNESQIEALNNSSETLQRRNPEDLPEELELSESGARFVRSVKALDSNNSI